MTWQEYLSQVFGGRDKVNKNLCLTELSEADFISMPQIGILVVEDDYFVLKFLKQLVPEFFLGTAFFATNAEEAIALWREHSAEISHLLTDITLPGTSGEKLASQLIIDKPSLRIIVSTGMPIPVKDLEAIIRTKITLLEKPFDVSAVARVFAEDAVAIAA